jgi:hypothetical protein
MYFLIYKIYQKLAEANPDPCTALVFEQAECIAQPPTLMDPITAIGLAGTVVNLVELTGTIIINLYRYYLDVKTSQGCVAGLREEIGLSLSLLGGLHDILETNETFQGTPELGNALLSFSHALKEVDDGIKSEIAKGLGRWKWPFLKQDTEKLIRKLGRYNGIFQLALNIEQMYIFKSRLG